MTTKIQTAFLTLSCLAGSANASSSYLSQPEWLQGVGSTNGLTVFSFQGPTELNGRYANDTNIVPSYSSQGVDFLPFSGTTIYPAIFQGQQYQVSAPNHDGLLSNESCTNPISDLEGRAIRFNFNIPVRAVGTFFNGPLAGGDYGYLEAFDSASNLIVQTPVCAAGGFVGLIADTFIAQVHIVNTGNADITYGIWDLQFVPALAQTCVPPPSGLVSWWTGDGNARDIVGGNNGILNGGVTFTNGQVDQAFSLDGVSGWVDVPNSDSLNPTGPFSLECWINASSQQFFPQVLIVDKSHGWTDGTGWGFQTTTNGTAGFFYGVGGPLGLTNWFPYVATSNSVLDDQWHHLAGVWTGTQLQVFEDGVQQDSTNQNVMPANNSRDVEVGRSWGGGSPTRFFHGLIDEVTYYNRALTATEIKSIFSSGSFGKCKPLWLSPQLSGNGVAIGFQSVSNQSYTVQQSANLATTNWSYYTNLPGNGSLLQLLAPGSKGPQMFFRVKRP